MKDETNSDRVSTPKRVKKRAQDDIAIYWYYATIQYKGCLLGLLIETDDEATAWEEADGISSGFDLAATVLDVKKVVVQ